MPWVKIDDGFDDDPDLDTLSDAAALLFLCSLSWSSRNLTNGFIPKQRALRIRGGSPETIIELVLIGWWTEIADGYYARNFNKYNPSPEEFLDRKSEISKMRSEAGKKGMESRWNNPENYNKHNKRITNTITNGIAIDIRTNNNCYNKNITPNPLSRIPDSESRNPDSRSGAAEDGTPPTTEQHKLSKTKDSEVSKRKRFIPPTPIEAEEYFTERGFGGKGLGQEYYDHHESRGWIMSNGRIMVNWRAAVRTWINNQSRFNRNGSQRIGTASPANIGLEKETETILDRVMELKQSVDKSQDKLYQQIKQRRLNNNDTGKLITVNGDDRSIALLPEFSLE